MSSSTDGYRDLLEAVNRGIEGVALPAVEAEPGDGSGFSTRLFVTGVPRTGTTLLMQLLAASGAVAYVSNFVARFYRNPTFGAALQELAAPLLPARQARFRSDYGRTRRWHQPHEFGFFWEHHLPFGDDHDPSPTALETVDWAALREALDGLAHRLGGPLALKNNLLACVTPALGRHLPGSVFVELRRDPEAVAHSLLRARREEAGGAGRWWSTRPAGWARLESQQPPVRQIAWQIAALDAAHARARHRVGEDRWVRLAYDDLCADPRAAVAGLAERFHLDPPDLDALPEAFPPSRVEEPDPLLQELGPALEEARTQLAAGE